MSLTINLLPYYGLCSEILLGELALSKPLLNLKKILIDFMSGSCHLERAWNLVLNVSFDFFSRHQTQIGK